MVTLVIAEKPSVARDIARVLGAKSKKDGYLEGAGYRVAWCVGHLMELCEPKDYDPAWKSWTTKTLPMVPEAFRTRPRKGVSKPLAVLRRLAKAADVERVVNACDAGREGELIFRWVWEHIRPRRRLPVERLWISSLTDRAIRDGFARLRAGRDFDRLAAAARSRAEADWLVGLNATRALTLLGRRGGAGQTLLSVGRVQTPTLALIAEREDAIDAFVSEPFWRVKARFVVDAERRFEAVFERKGKDRLAPKELAEALAQVVEGQRGTIAKVKADKTTRRAPPLYDLTALQKEANRRFGMSAKRTLGAAQALYERHKALTYPRTDSRFLTADVAGKLPAVLRAMGATPWSHIAQAALAGGPKPTRRIVNPSEVGDHHAILPTGKVPNLERLGADERRVYELVVRRTLAVFLPPAVFAKVQIDVDVPGKGGPHRFVARGTTRLVEGWELAEPPPPKRAKSQDPAAALPVVRAGEPADVAEVEILEGKTEPPKRYTEATLLAAMEGAGKDLDEEELRRAMKAAGLGTPATRASIIETLLSREYIVRDGKVLRPTAQGRLLVKSLPVPELRSAELTGRWEAALAEMAEGRGDRQAFMREIARFTADTVAALRVAAPPDMKEALAKDAKASEVLGRCPLCGTDVREGRKAYVCETGRECEFVIFKSVARKKISPALVKVLLGRGRSRRLRGFRSKKGKPFEAALVLGADGKVSMDFETGRPERKPRAEARKAADVPKDDRPRCPKCKRGRVMAGNRGWGCTRYREGCDMVVWFDQNGFRVPDDEAERLFRKKQTRLMTGLVDGKKARLVLDLGAPGNVRVELGKR